MRLVERNSFCHINQTMMASSLWKVLVPHSTCHEFGDSVCLIFPCTSSGPLWDHRDETMGMYPGSQILASLALQTYWGYRELKSMCHRAKSVSWRKCGIWAKGIVSACGSLPTFSNNSWRGFSEERENQYWPYMPRILCYLPLLPERSDDLKSLLAFGVPELVPEYQKNSSWR